MTRLQTSFQGRPKFSGIVFQVKLKIFLELSKNNYPFWLEWNSVSYLINLRPISIEYYLYICLNIEFTVFLALFPLFMPDRPHRVYWFCAVVSNIKKESR